MKCTIVFLLTAACFASNIGVAAVAVPTLKPGLWEMHYRSSVGGRNSALPPTVCVGAMSDQQRQLERDNIKNRCSKYESRQLEGKWVMDAECAARGHTVIKHVVTSLSGDSYHEENVMPEGNSSSDGKWLGPCKPNQQPDIFK